MNAINIISSADNLIRGYRRAEKASGWKDSTQRYGLNLLKETERLQSELLDGSYEQTKGTEFTVNERGHTRLIKAMTTRDTVLQHSLCDNILLPRLRPYLIHDNGASLKGKGVSFTRRRLEEQLHKYYRHHGNDGYVLLIDFRKFFDNIRHDKLIDAIHEKIPDDSLRQLITKLLKMYEVDVSYTNDENIETKVFDALSYATVDKRTCTGTRFMRKSLGIGASISQIAGVFFPTPIDTYCKTVMRCKYYQAYMDDRIVVHESKAFLQKLLQDIRRIADALGLFINERKTQIVKLSHGFTWLKVRYILTDTGKLVKRIPRDIITRERRKLKKLAKKVMRGEITLTKYREQYKSWRGDKKAYHAYHTLQNMDQLYKECLQWITKHRKSNRKSLTSDSNFPATCRTLATTKS